MTTTTKKLAVMVATVAAMTATAVPAYAQDQAAQYSQQQYGAAPQGQLASQGQEVSVTGVIQRLPSDGGPSPYGITDEASGTSYVLDRGEGGFSAYEGRRVTVTGTAQDLGAYENLDVSDIRAAEGEGPATDPPQGAEPTVSFELKTDCEPPAGARFFGLAGQEPAELSDPDGDGTYTGSLTLPEGFYDRGAFAMPVWIAEGTTEVPNEHTIKAFGKVVLKDGDAFSTDTSFCGATPDGGSTTGGATGSTGGGGTSGGGTETGNGGAVVSGDTSDAGKGGGSANASGVTAAQGSASSAAAKVLPSSVAKALPDTGGILPVAGLGGLVLIAGGLLARRIFR